MTATTARRAGGGKIRDRQRLTHLVAGVALVAYLTDQARAIEHEIIAAARSVNASATDGLTDAETTSYLNLTARLIHNLETDAE
jgi:hypothetical protein